MMPRSTLSARRDRAITLRTLRGIADEFNPAQASHGSTNESQRSGVSNPQAIGGDMVTIGMNYKVIPGKEGVFEAAFRNVIKAMAGIAGHTATRMCRDIDDPQSYVILSDWSDRAAFEGFIGSDAFRAVANWGKEQILAGRPSHTYYEH